MGRERASWLYGGTGALTTVTGKVEGQSPTGASETTDVERSQERGEGAFITRWLVREKVTMGGGGGKGKIKEGVA